MPNHSFVPRPFHPSILLIAVPIHCKQQMLGCGERRLGTRLPNLTCFPEPSQGKRDKVDISTGFDQDTMVGRVPCEPILNGKN